MRLTMPGKERHSLSSGWERASLEHGILLHTGNSLMWDTPPPGPPRFVRVRFARWATVVIEEI